MRVKPKTHQMTGYTLIEMLIVVAIVALLASIATPRLELVLQNAHQAKARGTLASLRAAVAIYYTDNDAIFPLAFYPEGNTHYTSDGLSLTSVLIPKYISNLPPPTLKDKMGSFNGLSASFDTEVKRLMSQSPPYDVIIIAGEPDYTPMVDAPFAYDNSDGTVYIPNGNFSTKGRYYYEW